MISKVKFEKAEYEVIFCVEEASHGSIKISFKSELLARQVKFMGFDLGQGVYPVSTLDTSTPKDDCKFEHA